MKEVNSLDDYKTQGVYCVTEGVNNLPKDLCWIYKNEKGTDQSYTVIAAEGLSQSEHELVDKMRKGLQEEANGRKRSNKEN